MDLSHLLNAAPEAPLATVRTPIPEGDYPAKIDNLEFRTVKTKVGDERPIMTVTWEILDEALQVKMDREKVTIRQDIWLDLDEYGGLDTGTDRNVDLGKLRDIFGQNEPGVPIGALKGTPPALINVRQRKVEGRDDIFSDVTRVAPLKR